jgi:hypothetical protein
MIIDFKINKSASLTRSLKTNWNKRIEKKRFEVKFLPFVISSLGALPNKSIASLTKIIGTETKNIIGLSAKKLFVT